MFTSNFRFLSLKIKRIKSHKGSYFHWNFSTSQKSSNTKEASLNSYDQIKNTNYSRDYLADIVRQEIKTYIHQRNKEMRFVPNELDANILQGKNTDKNDEIVKLFGDYLHSQDTSYWSGLSDNVTFRKLHLVKPEIELIAFSIFKKLQLGKNELLKLKGFNGLEEGNSIEEAISYVDEVINNLDKEKSIA